MINNGHGKDWIIFINIDMYNLWRICHFDLEYVSKFVPGVLMNILRSRIGRSFYSTDYVSPIT